MASPRARRGAGRALALAAVVTAGLALAACGRGPPAGPGLRLGNGAEPETLDPHRAEGTASGNIVRDLFEGLVTEGPAGGLAPGVASDWTVSADRQTYVFHLRPEARWSNGEPLTATDFVYSLRRVADPRTASPYAGMLSPIANASAVVAGRLPPERLAVRALDDHTLEIRLGGPVPYFLAVLAHPAYFPVHRASVERFGAGFVRPGYLVSNGAYRLADWRVQAVITLVRNRFYWHDAATRIETVSYYPTEDLDAEQSRYLAGELDATADIPFGAYARRRRQLPAETHVATYLGTYFYVMNTTRPPFNDVRVRRALAMSLDPPVLAAKVAGRGESPAWGLVPAVTGYPRQSVPWRDWPLARRLAAARQGLGEAGYSAARPLAFELLYNTSENHRRMAVAVAAMWRQRLGFVSVRLRNEETRAFMGERADAGKFQMARYTWIADYDDAASFLELAQTGNAQNDAKYSNPAFDHLLDRAAHEPDAARRQQWLAAAERLMLADVPMLPIYFYVSHHLVRPRVRGWTASPLDHTYTRSLWLAAPGGGDGRGGTGQAPAGGAS